MHMKLFPAATAANRISDNTVLMGSVLCGVFGFSLVLPLAVSSPYPTPKQGDWIVQPASIRPASLEAASPRAPTDRVDPLSAPETKAAVEAMSSMERTASVQLASLVEAPSPMEPTSLVEAVAAVETTSAVTRTPPAARFSFADRWSPTSYVGEVAASVEMPPEAARLESPARLAILERPDTPERTSSPLRRRAGTLEEVDQYLWEVYLRKPVKSDSSGDFTWKDPAAAKHANLPLKDYVIGGMDPEFREQLYHAGRAMDAAGLQWSMLSAFRDDYRQGLASGFKASVGNSLHGGSRRTGGYGHGRAIDITGPEGKESEVWRWIDSHGAKYGLHRPLPGADPAHIQQRGDWHTIALTLRESRVRLAGGDRPKPAAASRTRRRVGRSDHRSSIRRLSNHAMSTKRLPHLRSVRLSASPYRARRCRRG